MHPDDFTGLLATFGTFGGVALIIWTSMMGKIARIKAEAEARRTAAEPLPGGVTEELRALRQQVAELSGTSHSFDISFDEALNRLEGRINRLETKSAVSTAAPATTDTPSTLRNGQSQ